MKNDFTAFCMLAFTVFVVIACFWCLSPVFASLGTVWNFLCQYVAFNILWNVVKDLYNYIKKQLDSSNKEDKTNK